MASVVEVTPRLRKNLCNRSTARPTRFLAVSSFAPKAAPTSRMLLPSKNRSTTAWRSVSFKPAIAASSSGAICL
ncbi:MAG TPA: hypothetical protein VK731_08615, partial [Candidatus Cybelea sp.]|nr:hypothetical protein [Candidatus Cybelea sp.]